MLKLKILIFTILVLSINNSFSNIKIKYKIENEIITNIDIEEEKKYLIFFNPNLKNLTTEQITKISENSLIREIIKKRELKRIFKDFEDKKFIDKVKLNLFKFKGVSNENEFKKILFSQDINYERVIDKIKYEGMWNELIFRKYINSVRINEKNLKLKLTNKISNNKKFEYNLSEILFEIKGVNDLNKLYKEILDYININSFDAAVSKYSISNSSLSGGKLGWIKETLLSENLVKILSSLKNGSITKPIKYPNGYLVLKINNKREIRQNIDLEKELQEMIKFEQNKQLNQFSLLFYKKLKQNIEINEY